MKLVISFLLLALAAVSLALPLPDEEFKTTDAIAKALEIALIPEGASVDKPIKGIQKLAIEAIPEHEPIPVARFFDDGSDEIIASLQAHVDSIVSS
jgi:hypothetical protein